MLCHLFLPFVIPTDIQIGQGLYYETITQTWRAKDCRTNNYGVDNSTFGLQAAPCKDCPSGTVAATSLTMSAQHYTENADGTGGFDDEMACVTKPGVCSMAPNRVLQQLSCACEDQLTLRPVLKVSSCQIFNLLVSCCGMLLLKASKTVLTVDALSRRVEVTVALMSWKVYIPKLLALLLLTHSYCVL